MSNTQFPPIGLFLVSAPDHAHLLVVLQRAIDLVSSIGGPAELEAEVLRDLYRRVSAAWPLERFMTDFIALLEAKANV